MPTESILNAATAYSSRQYQGNLYDILNALNPTIKCASPTLSNIQITQIGSPPKVYIDNQALEGFIDFFKEQECLSGCSHCDYCQKIADKVVSLDRREVDEYVAGLKNFLNDLTSRIFHPVSTRH